MLSRDDFALIQSNSDLLNATSMARKEQNLRLRMHSQNLAAQSLVLNDLQRLRILGRGTFGTVYLVETSSSASLKGVFALKMMNKTHLVACDQKTNVMAEKNVLSEIDHPFVLELVKTFTDRDSLYFLLEFVQGGELFSIMQDKYRLPQHASMFYAACIVEVFDYLHSLNIVYRDLKPENVLIDRFGYVKMADFGFAKKIADKTFYVVWDSRVSRSRR